MAQTWLGRVIEYFIVTDNGSPHLLAWFFYLLLFFMAVDVITGWLKAIYNGELDSSKNFKGYIRKSVILILSLTSICIDFGVSITLQFLGASEFIVFGINMAQVPLISILVFIWLILGELLSITENLGVMGVRLPKFLMQWLNRMQDKIDEGDIDVGKIKKPSKEDKENDKHG